MEYKPIQASNLLELYLADGMFLAGFFYDNTNKAQPLEAFTHRGMLVDSQLICQKGVRALFECRYYLECGGIRFYGKEFLCRPIQIHNLGPDTLKIHCGRFCTTLEPEQQTSIAPTAMVCEG